MCLNRKYTYEQQKELDTMRDYAKMILQGIEPKDIALDEGVTEEEVYAVIEKLKGVNEYLYHQVQAKLKG